MQKRNGGTYQNGEGAQYWLAWDKDGTEYRFGFTLHSNHTIGGGYEYRYDLERIRDTRANYIQYLRDETTDNESGSYDSDRDFWLTEIRYTDAEVHILKGREVQRYSDATSGHVCVDTYYDGRGLDRPRPSRTARPARAHSCRAIGRTG